MIRIASYDANTLEKIAVYNSFVDALIDVGASSTTPIKEACECRNRVAYNRFWRYCDERDRTVMTHQRISEKRIPVLMLDKNTGEVIRSFDSIVEASKFISPTGVPNANISAVCKGQRKTAGGYKWRYDETAFL